MLNITFKDVNFTCEDYIYVAVKRDLCNMMMLDMLLPRCNI